MIFKKIFSKQKKTDENSLEKRIERLEKKVDKINEEGANLVLINRAMIENAIVKTFIIEDISGCYITKSKKLTIIYYKAGNFYRNSFEVDYSAIAMVIKDTETEALIRVRNLKNEPKIYVLNKVCNSIADITKWYYSERGDEE
jgi:hypothetical protein